MFKTIVLLSVISFAVAGCQVSDPGRAIIGAAAGAAIADSAGQNAALGAGAGAIAGLIIK